MKPRGKKDVVLGFEELAPVFQPFLNIEENQNLFVGVRRGRDATGKVHMLAIELL